MLAAYSTVGQEIAKHALQTPHKPALIVGDVELSYAQLDAQMNRIAAALTNAGLQATDAISLCAAPSANYAMVFLAALRAGIAVAPLAPSCTPEQLSAMVNDSDAKLLFLDEANCVALAPHVKGFTKVAQVVDLELGLEAFCGTAEEAFTASLVDPAWAFNLIYSSGTTGVPKGIVQSHGMRWTHVQRAVLGGYTNDAVTILATPLYSNTTLVSVFPTLALGGTLIVQPKFDARKFLELAQSKRATHTILVPVIYKRLLAHQEFDSFDLSSFKAKFCTSAPLTADLKGEILRRWPSGGLTDSYGMTEGGAVVSLQAHIYPHKLHTVGKPVLGHEVRLLDDDGKDVPLGQSGEIVGRSPGMMNGYHKLPDKTAEMEWFDEHGGRWFKTGDVGKFDDDGFLILQDRKKDMIISGGFNVYPSDLEAVLREHQAVNDVAVVGLPSEEWGETPVAFVVLHKAFAGLEPEHLRQEINAKLAKTQRLSSVCFVAELPRSAIGKVLKRELRDSLASS